MKSKDEVFRKVYLNEGQDTVLSVIDRPKGKESGILHYFIKYVLSWGAVRFITINSYYNTRGKLYTSFLFG